MSSSRQREVSGVGRYEVRVWLREGSVVKIETFPWLDATERDAVVEFAQERRLPFTVAESRSRGGSR